MLELTPYTKPKFNIPLPPKAVYSVGSCCKGDYDKIVLAVATAAGSGVYQQLTEKLLGKKPKAATDVGCYVFLKKYRETLDKYMDGNIDFMRIPEKPDFGKDDNKAVKFPIATCGERFVAEHTGLNFIEINQLDIIEYRLFLADAVKMRILRREDGKGGEYLNECYNFMHKKSTMFD